MMIRPLVALLLFATAAIAQPTINSVTGTVSAGESITIAGSGFGTKAQATPLLWETFEDGAAGDDLTSSRWVNYLGSYSAEYNDGSSAVNGSGWTLDAYGGDLFASNRVAGEAAPGYPYSRHGFATNNFFFPATDTLYYSYMVRWDVYDVTANNYGVAKFGRMNASPNRYNGNGMFGVSSMNPNSGGSLYALHWPGGAQVNLPYVTSPPRGQWRWNDRFEERGMREVSHPNGDERYPEDDTRPSSPCGLVAAQEGDVANGAGHRCRSREGLRGAVRPTRSRTPTSDRSRRRTSESTSLLPSRRVAQGSA
jgi:hypothetical protein